MLTIKTELGEVKILEEVIKSIVSLNLLEVKGIVENRKTLTKEITNRLAGKAEIADNNTSPKIKVEVKDNHILVDLFIIIKYGLRIPDIAWDIQNKIKDELLRETGIDNIEINLHIQGIQFPKKTQSRKELAASDLFIQVI